MQPIRCVHARARLRPAGAAAGSGQKDAVREGLFGAFAASASSSSEKEKVREQAAHEEKLYRIKLFEPDLKLLSAATDRRRGCGARGRTICYKAMFFPTPVHREGSLRD